MSIHTLFVFIATGCYSGFAKKIPGTFGTLATVPLILLTDWMSVVGKFLVFIVLFVTGIIVSEYYEKYTGKEDPKEVVIDEIAAYYLTMIFLETTFWNVLVTFFLFRFFDITKIYPANKAEDIAGGTGIMLDDIVAAVYSIISFFVLKGILWG